MILISSLAFIGAAVAAVQSVPSLKVPSCPKTGTLTYNKSVPDKSEFPQTQVDLCYTDDSIKIVFTAKDETNFYFNCTQGTNDDIWAYEVMEAFIYHGTSDPQTYLEFEVNPHNVTYQAFVYNPSKVRAADAPFDHFFITDPLVDGLTADTTLDKPSEKWVSSVSIPLGLFNVDIGQAKGTEWRMNFFRTVVSPSTYPDQLLGGWSVPPEANFHITPSFGDVHFI